MISPEKKNVLDAIYFDDRGNAGSYSSFKPLYLVAKKKDPTIRASDIKEYLKSVRAYVQHKRILRKITRRKYLIFAPFEFFQLDIIYLQPMSVISKKGSHAKNYGLTAVDAFTKKGFVELIYKKSAPQCLEAFKTIIEKAQRLPRICQVDGGSEFKSVFQKWCTSQNIRLYSSNTELQKAQLCEIFNYHLKLILNRILTHHRSKDFSRYIQQACSIYNAQPSTVLPKKMSPNEAARPENISILQLYYLRKRAEFAQKVSKKRPLPAFFLGQKVRKIQKKTDTFGIRGYKPRFSDQIFTVSRISNTIPIGYFLAEDKNPRLYYAEELADVISNEKDQEPQIESISNSRQQVETRLRSGKPISKITEYLTSIEGETNRKYLTESEIKQYKNGKFMLEKYLANENGR